MAQNGTLLVRAFVSNAQLPVPGATVIVSKPEPNGRQRLLSIQLTNENGVAGPITLEAPDTAGSLNPGNNGSSFYDYTLLVEHPGYQLAVFEELQIFPGVETVQDIPLIPLSANGRNESDTVTVTPQPL
jgi:hypothetical protein